MCPVVEADEFSVVLHQVSERSWVKQQCCSLRARYILAWGAGHG